MKFNAIDTAVYCSLLAFWAASVLYGALRSDNTMQLTKITQRRRYTHALFAECIFAASAVWLVFARIPYRLPVVASELFRSVGPASLILDLGLVLIPLNLAMTPAAFLYIYRRPVPMAVEP